MSYRVVKRLGLTSDVGFPVLPYGAGYQLTMLDASGGQSARARTCTGRDVTMTSSGVRFGRYRHRATSRSGNSAERFDSAAG